MNTRSSDFPEQTRARAASILPGTEPGVAPAQIAADEAAVMNILRLLNRVKLSSMLMPVERAFVLGARAMFEELTTVCDNLLKPMAPLPKSELPAAPSAPTDQAQTPVRARAAKRLTTGGASAPPR